MPRRRNLPESTIPARRPVSAPQTGQSPTKLTRVSSQGCSCFESRIFVPSGKPSRAWEKAVPCTQSRGFVFQGKQYRAIGQDKGPNPQARAGFPAILTPSVGTLETWLTPPTPILPGNTSVRLEDNATNSLPKASAPACLISQTSGSWPRGFVPLAEESAVPHPRRNEARSMPSWHRVCRVGPRGPVHTGCGNRGSLRRSSGWGSGEGQA